MESLQHWGIDFIINLQSKSTPFLDGFFYLTTQLGGFGYLFIIPLLVWCIEPKLGLRALLAMMISQYICMLIKDIVQEPRPFLVDPRIISDGEHGFSFPSGHAMGSMLFYGLLALWTEKRWLRWVLGALIFFIGLSRSYLGVHYPHDVVAGWLLGIIYLWGWLQLQRPVEQRYYRLPFSMQLLTALLLPALIGSIHNSVFNYPFALAISGSVPAALLCMAAERRSPLLTAQGTLLKKGGRYLIGMFLVFGSMKLLGMVYPENPGLLQNCAIWLNGALIVTVIGYFAPRVFMPLKLLPSPR